MKKIGIAIGILSLAAMLQSQAAEIIGFHSSNVVTKTTFFGDYALDTNTAKFPNGAANAGQSFYSGFVENTGVGAASQWNSGTGGAGLRWEGGGVSNDVATGVYLFKKEDFLNGLDTGTVSMDAANDTVSLNFGFLNGGVADTARIKAFDLRLVIQNGANWYISDTASAYSGGIITVEATELGYSAYDPIADLSGIGASTTASFDDIQFFGYYVSATRGGDLQGANASLQEFSAQAVPEPATIGLVGTFTLAILFVRRRFVS